MGRKPKNIRGIWLISDLSTNSACFVIFFVRHLYFCFMEYLTIDFAIGRSKSKGIDIAIDFSK